MGDRQEVELWAEWPGCWSSGGAPGGKVGEYICSWGGRWGRLGLTQVAGVWPVELVELEEWAGGLAGRPQG